MGKKGKILDYQTIIRIKKLYESGSSMREIKEETGLSLGTVFKYLNNEKEQDEIKSNKQQSGNQLEDLKNEIEQIKTRLKQLEEKNYLPMVRKKEETKSHARPVQTKIAEGIQYLPTSKIIMLVKTAKGDQPCNDTIQRVMKAWRYNNPDFNSKKGYPLDALLINLKAWNLKSKDANKLDISELENIK